MNRKQLHRLTAAARVFLIWSWAVLVYALYHYNSGKLAPSVIAITEKYELLSHYEIYRGIITQANDVTRHNNEVTRPNSEVTRRNNEATMLNDDVTRPGRKVNTDYSATFFTLSTDVEYIEQPTSSDFQTITET